jgi:T-complex protein 1 subunit delta
MREGNRASEVRKRSIAVARAIKATLASSLGPRGMDKMISKGTSTTITNDGTTILKAMEMQDPIAKVISNISGFQDEESGDGTTTITILTCSLLEAAGELLKQKIDPVVISNSMEIAKRHCREVLTGSSEQILQGEKEEAMRRSIKISLNSKVVNSCIEKITDVTAEVIKRIEGKDERGMATAHIKNVRIVKTKGAIDESVVVDGIVVPKELKRGSLGGKRTVNVAIFQSTVGQSKPYLDSKMVVGDYEAMERVVREEKKHVLEICKKIKEKDIHLILMQKSIVRESVSELGIHFLEKLGVHVVDDIERADIEFYIEKLGILPVVDASDIRPEMVRKMEAEEIECDEKNMICLRGAKNTSGEEFRIAGVCSVILKGTDDVILEEVARSFNDAINVARLVVEMPMLTCGGGVPEMVCYSELSRFEGSGDGKIDYCIRGLAKAFLSIPALLAINAGIDSIEAVERLIKMYSADIKCRMGVSVKENGVGDMRKEGVIQPLGISLGCVSGALDGASLILRIDDYIPV